MNAWISKNWKQCLILFFSFASAVVIYKWPQYTTWALAVGAALGTIGIRLMPLTLTSAPGDKAEAPPASLVAPDAKEDSSSGAGPALMAFLIAVSFLGFSACATATKAELAKSAADLISCLDKNIDSPPEVITLTCGLELTPDLVSLMSERKQIRAAQRNPGCTIITVDAGAPDGAGK